MANRNFYVEITPTKVRIKGSLEKRTIFQVDANPKNIGRMILKCGRMLNSCENDTITWNIKRHLESIGQGHKFQAHHYPLQGPIYPTIVRKGFDN